MDAEKRLRIKLQIESFFDVIGYLGCFFVGFLVGVVIVIFNSDEVTNLILSIILGSSS